jgi:molybdopterin molybdotransferase
MSGLLSVDEALARIVGAVTEPVDTETISINDAAGRRLAAPLVATRTQPPFPASAMDGYAVRAADLMPGVVLKLVGESAAGRRFPGSLGVGETIRIFTGAPVPEGADTILIQENARRDGDAVIPTQSEAKGRYVRPAGVDFRAGDSFFCAGHRLMAKDMALAASLGPGTALVRRRPRIMVLATGDELVNPGETPGQDQIVAANHLSVLRLIANAGADGRFLGIARDTMSDLRANIASALDWKADVLVTMGGASVGDHDLVQAALAEAGMRLGFWKIAMRPGKPLMFGGVGRMLALGLPGNPASSVVCAHVFLKPLISALHGAPDALTDLNLPGVLGRDLPENDLRMEYMRATLAPSPDGLPILTPAASQDSSLTRVLAAADALVIRPAHAPAAKAGEPCRYAMLD